VKYSTISEDTIAHYRTNGMKGSDVEKVFAELCRLDAEIDRRLNAERAAAALLADEAGYRELAAALRTR
jgi:hypothetical protein